MIKLFLSDLDGTLLDKNLQFNQRDIEAIHHLKKEGIEFGIVTGRDLGIYYTQMKPTLQFDMDYIGNNGGTVLADDKKIYEMNLNSQEIYEMMKKIQMSYPDDIYPFVADDHGNFYFSDTKPKSPFWQGAIRVMERAGVISKRSLLDYLSEPKDGIVKVSLYTKEESPQDIVRELSKRYGDKFEISITYAHFVELTTKGINKGTAIHKLLEHRGLQPDEVAVIGDGENDIPMFKMFKNTFVMDNAKEAVKEYGEVIVESVADAIGLLLKERK
ncbi:MAG: Cof-type HAD-IIB family hydrolase [Breznakia sp.]